MQQLARMSQDLTGPAIQSRAVLASIDLNLSAWAEQQSSRDGGLGSRGDDGRLRLSIEQTSRAPVSRDSIGRLTHIVEEDAQRTTVSVCVCRRRRRRWMIDSDAPTHTQRPTRTAAQID
jgi:hypothetical protein